MGGTFPVGGGAKLYRREEISLSVFHSALDYGYGVTHCFEALASTVTDYNLSPLNCFCLGYFAIAIEMELG